MLVNILKQYIFGKEIYSTLELKAASLVRNLVQKHVFFNANKRTALISLCAFLNINGYQLTIINTEATNDHSYDEPFLIYIICVRRVRLS